MRCPFCENVKDRVVDSRMSKNGALIRRRRECLGCGRRFTTYEQVEGVPYTVLKKDGRREEFDRQKVLRGLLRACEKRPVTMAQIEGMVSAAESLVIESGARECTTASVGDLLMRELSSVDAVAYVRFASVYRDFQDPEQFLREVLELVEQAPGEPEPRDET